MNKIEVGKTYTTNSNETVLILGKLDNPVVTEAPFIGVYTQSNNSQFIGYVDEQGRFNSFVDHKLNVKWGPVVRTGYRRVYENGVIGNEYAAITSLPDNAHNHCVGIIVTTYHDGKLYNFAFQRAQ